MTLLLPQQEHTVTSVGNAVTILSGAGGATSGVGGPVNITSGASPTSGAGGAINLTTGSAVNSASGSINLTTGATGNNGGSIVMNLGFGTAPGHVSIRSSTSTGNTPELKFWERAANGSNYVSLHAPLDITTNRVWTLPIDDSTAVAGQFLTTDTLGNLSFAAVVLPTSATDTTEGIIELATQTEVDTGTDATRAVTPATLQKKAEETAMLMSVVFGI